MQSNTITIYTDGSSKGNPGPGGWAAIISDGEKVKEIGGREEHTTNNRMEMMAVIKALEFISEAQADAENAWGWGRSGQAFSASAGAKSQAFFSKPSALPIVAIFTDSSYVAKGASEWLAGWQRKGWKNSQKQEVLNRDLWERIAELIEKFDITWKIIPGHAGIAGNERCDEIATAFADDKKIKLRSD